MARLSSASGFNLRYFPISINSLGWGIKIEISATRLRCVLIAQNLEWKLYGEHYYYLWHCFFFLIASWQIRSLLMSIWNLKIKDCEGITVLNACLDPGSRILLVFPHNWLYRVCVNFPRFPFSKSYSTEFRTPRYVRCLRINRRPDPLCLHIFPSPLSSPADSSPFPLAFSGHPALNNKYERVLREYPEGAISGVQARALGPTLSHTLKPTSGPPLAPSSSASSMTRNANLIHLEMRRAVRYGKRARVPAIALWRQPPFFLLYVSTFFSFFELARCRWTND